jgi:hypothetical protein
MDLNTNPVEQIPAMPPGPEKSADIVNNGVYEVPAPATQSVEATPHTVAEAEAVIRELDQPKTQEQMFAEHLYKIAKLDALYFCLVDSAKEQFMKEFHQKVINDFYVNHLDQKKNDKELANNLNDFFKSFPYSVGVDGNKSDINSYFVKQEAGNAASSMINALQK